MLFRSEIRPRQAPSAQLPRESTAARGQGAFPGPTETPDRWPGAHGAAQQDLPLGGQLSPRAAFNPVRPQRGEADPCASSPPPPPRGHLASPPTAHPYPPTAQAWLGSGRYTGDKWGAAEVPESVTPGLSPARTPVRRRGSGAGRALSTGAPPAALRAAPRGGQRPPAPARSRREDACGCPAAGVRSGPAASPALCSPPPPFPLHAPPNPRPPGPGRPPAPRRAPPAQQLDRKSVV